MTSPEVTRAAILAAHYDWFVREVQPGFRGSELARKGAFDSSAAGYGAGYSHGYAEAEAGRTDAEVLAGLGAAHDAWWKTVQSRRSQRIPAHVEAFSRRWSRAGYEAGAAFGVAAQGRAARTK